MYAAKITPYWIESRKLWRVRVRKDGKSKSFTSSIPRAEGKRIVRQKALEWLQDDETDDGLPLSTVYDRFLLFYAEKCGKNTSYRRYLSFGNNHILPRLGKKAVGSITLDQWQSCISKATPQDGRTQELSKKTLGAIKETLTAFMTWARPRKYIAEDFSSELYIPKAAEVKGKEILQIDDIKRWLSDPTGLWYERALMFQLFVGFRPGEVLGLQRSDYDHIKHIITVNRAINNHGEITPGKNKNAHRSVLLDGLALRLLEEQFKVTEDLDTEWIFCGKFGQKPSPQKYYQTMQKIVEARDMPHVSPYCLRHTFLSLVEGYLPSRAMKAVFGHSEATDSHALYGNHTVDGELVGITERLKVTPLYRIEEEIL